MGICTIWKPRSQEDVGPLAQQEGLQEPQEATGILVRGPQEGDLDMFAVFKACINWEVYFLSVLAHPTLLPGPHSHILLCFFVLALLVQRNASYMGGTKEMGCQAQCQKVSGLRVLQDMQCNMFYRWPQPRRCEANTPQGWLKIQGCWKAGEKWNSMSRSPKAGLGRQTSCRSCTLINNLCFSRACFPIR